MTDEALLDERLERVEVGVAGRFGGLEGAAAVEDGQAGEQLFPVLVEKLVRPCDRRAEGLMAGLGVSASFEEVEPPAEPIEDLRRGKHGASRSCELDREREIVEAAAELDDRFVGLRSRALAEEADGVRSVSGATAYSTSPRMRSSSRLVTSRWRFGHASRRVASSRAASITCSRLSRSRSSSRSPTCSASPFFAPST